MANPDNGGDNRSYEGSSSLYCGWSCSSPIDPSAGTATGLAAMNPLFCEQLHQVIMETINSTLYGSLASEQDLLRSWKEVEY
ncbi:UNVERIFIED_CONTAM: hypothetical protein Sradi_1897800 [Sesamum radiatum]|uniref:Uncharacterized protein n=1 Tax=Sesamum radiatum TaxID=300843 RepID=A0AAW2TYK1_SESRA